MKSLILTVAYLWKDTWNRWLEQPGSPLARGVVVAILSILSAFLLIGFYLQEKSITQKIEALGANTIVLRDSSSQLPNGSKTIEKLLRYFPELNKLGDTLHLEMLPVIAKDDKGGVIPVISSHQLQIQSLSEFVLYTNDLPENMSVRMEIQQGYVSAISKKSPQWFTSAGLSKVLLIPVNWRGYFSGLGSAEILIFNDDPDQAPELEFVVEAIEKLKRSENLNSLQVVSPIHLRAELKQWRDKALVWKRSLLISLALVISLICGTISILEFRQNLYVYSLMKSFGISNQLLYLRHFGDSFIVANIFSVLSVIGVYWLTPLLFANFGFSSQLVVQSIESPVLWMETAQLLFGVNLGVFLGSLPVYVALRKPIGLVLN